MNRSVFWLAALLLTFTLTVASAAPGYHVIKKIPLGGEGGWDYLTVDPAAERLYVSRATHVVVVDLKTEKVIGDIPDTLGVHGIALAPALNRGFISCGKADQVVIFDLKTLKTLGQAKTGANPDTIIYDPASKHVFSFDGRGKDSTVIDPSTGAIVGTIPLGGKPEAALADGKGRIYVNIEDTGEVAVLDSAKLTVLGRYPVKPGEEPSGMGLDVKKHRVYSGCSNKLMTVLDGETGKLLAAVPIGAGVDGNGYDADLGLAFSANGEGNVTVVRESSPGKFEVAETVPTLRGARTMALDTKSHRIYLPTAEFGPTPAPTPENPRPRPAPIKDTFVILVVGR